MACYTGAWGQRDLHHSITLFVLLPGDQPPIASPSCMMMMTAKSPVRYGFRAPDDVLIGGVEY